MGKVKIGIRLMLDFGCWVHSEFKIAHSKSAGSAEGSFPGEHRSFQNRSEVEKDCQSQPEG